MDVFVSTLPVDLQECDLLIMGLFEDERPLRGPCGWVDWRLNGWLSRSLILKRVTGAWREMTLIPSERRALSRFILLVGLGKVRDYSYLRLREIVPILLKTLRKLDASKIGLSFPEDEEHQVESGKMAEVIVEGIADSMTDIFHHPDEKKWIEGLSLFFIGGRDRYPQMTLGVQTAKATTVR